MKNDTYQTWVSQVCESEGTIDVHLDSIRRFGAWLQENRGLDAREIPARWRTAKYKSWPDRERFLDELTDVAKDYFAYLKGRGYAPLVVNRHMSTLMSYLHTFDIPVKSIRLRYPYVKYHNRDITKEEITRILDHSGVRNRAVYLILYESAMRPITLTKLRWRHIKEEFLRRKIPMKIDLPSEILKCRVMERWTFIGEEGYEALKRHLETRLPLKDEDYLFATEKPPGRKLRTGTISDAFSTTVLNLGITEPRDGKPKELHLYCLRSAFRKFIQTEEAYKEFWMGHTGTKTHYVSKDPEFHRQLYAQGYETLRLHKKEVDVETIARLTRENVDLKRRMERLESILEELADLKAQIKREERLLNSENDSS